MKKVFIILVSLFALMAASTGLKAQEVTILLRPGWNWIGYPYAEPIDLENAFVDFEPMNDDVIQSFWGYSEYAAGYGWFGAVDELQPGWGYMYYSNRTEAVIVELSAPASQTTVTTNEPTNITAESAVAGGTVTVPEGSHVFLRGVCWGTEPNPDIDGDHTTEETGIGSFSSTLDGLNPNTTYYVRAYVVSDYGLAYGNELSFTTEAGGSGGDHEYVDLGLPSGLLWATCNVGADAPEDYGDYFAWGETQPKDIYNWSTYQYCNGDYNTLTKYCNNSSYGYNGFTDNLTTLLPEDDAAAANWGSDWRMPTKEEWQELLNNTTVTWTTQNGVNGRLFTAPNGNSLFLPAAGYRWDGELNSAGNFSIYWSSSLNTDSPRSAGSLFSTYVDNIIRSYGFSVRPVLQITSFFIEATANPIEGGVVIGSGAYEEGALCELTATANEGYAFVNWSENGEVVSVEATYSFIVSENRNLVANFSISSGDHAYVDLGLPSGLLWATCNVGAYSPEEYGDYFAWGETQPKDYYDWSTYQYCMGSSTTMTKYCDNPSYGYNGFTDNLTTLLPEDDAATANWGSDWRMPTIGEWQELYNNTTCTWTTQNGVNGHLFTASNGNSLFLPAAGCRGGSDLNWAGSIGYYWSSSLDTDYPGRAWERVFHSDGYGMDFSGRYYGQSVRPVRYASQNTAPTGAIDGKFTINADGDQVYFSQGNLQYQASTNTWKFAENQYDYVGSDNSNISSTYDGWIDLFGWGTSGYHDESDTYNVNYQPWSTSTSQVNSSYNYFGYGPSTNMTDPDLTGTSANYDWGVYNPISNGSNTTNQWRTLGHSEWVYLFIHRTTISGIRYAKANVSGVNGVILLPDDWSTDTYSLNNPNDDGGSFGDNVLTDSQWVTLESAGAVFLPAAGYRYETYFGYAEGSGGYENSGGYYWSASGGDRDSANCICFYDWCVNMDVKLRFYGFSVRLVRVAE